jgi:6-phosphogluconolactonase (cycloisomerase 2 family)
LQLGKTRFSAGGAKLPGRRKQMNLHNISRMAKASIVSLAMVLGLSSCSLDYVVGYVYMTTSHSSPGVINQYAIDFQSGALSPVGTPVAAGNNPVRLVASPSGRFVYVVNQGDSTVQEFAVQSDGSLVSKNTYKTTGTSPTAVAIDPQGAFLYVTYTYQTGYSSTAPGPGGVTIFPVNADNSLGTATNLNVGNNPVGVSVSYFNHYVYVLDQETTTTPQVLGFSQNTTTGALTPVPGTTITTVGGKTVAIGYAAGVVPSAIAEEPTSRFLYVTDQAANQLIGYTVAPNGALTAMINGPFQTGLFPVNLTIDPQGTIMYVANYNSNTVEGYAIDTFTGTPSGAVGAFGTPVGTGPTCVAVDPALGTFLYTSDSLDNTVTGERLNPSTGGLSGVQNSPFPTQGAASASPTCLAIVPNGSHASQIINP